MACTRDRVGRTPLFFLVGAVSMGCAYDFDAPFASGVGGAGGTAVTDGGSGDVSTDPSDGAAGASPDADASLADHASDTPVEVLPVEDVVSEDVVSDTGECPSDHICVPVAPPGWSGPFALREDNVASVNCTDDYDDEVFRLYGGLKAAAASCSPCSCGAVTGTQCRMDLDLYLSKDCSGLSCVSSNTAASVCTDLSCSGNPALGSIRFGSHVSSSGSCPPSAQNPSLAPVSWDVHAVLCQAPAATGCGSDSVCLPNSADPSQLSMCVARPGDQSCMAPFTARTVRYEGFVDGRDCTACSCSAPQGGTCGGSVILNLPGPSCGGPGVVYPDGFCMELDPPVTSGAILGPLSLTGASCQASGGSPTGSASPTSLVTVCCLP